jgi:ubiquinone/menaquinone biosynthesis C-methylase UbiE
MLENTALHAWQEQITAYRKARLETEDQSWQHVAAWYEDWVRYNDYVQLTLPRLLPYIHNGARILEIGPGTGAFTVPFAVTARQVVVVEPSLEMRAILQHNLAVGEIENVEIIAQPVETAVGNLKGQFDLAFASFSLYNVSAIDMIFRDLMRLAKRTMVLIGTGEPISWYWDLYLRWRGKSPVPAPQLSPFYAVLTELGIYADVQIYQSSYNYVFDTEETLVDWWQRYFQLGEDQRAALRASLLPWVERRDPQVGIFSQSRIALVSIERGRNWIESES